MKISLVGDTLLAKDLTWSEAWKAMEAAEKKQGDKFYFYIKNSKTEINRWDLFSFPIELSRMLKRDPKAFFIEIKDEVKRE